MSAFGFSLSFGDAPIDQLRFARLARWLTRRAQGGLQVVQSAYLCQVRAHFEPNSKALDSTDPNFFFEGWLSETEALESLLDVRGESLSDANLVARALEVRGIDALKLLRGSFALALFDPARRRLILARDALGVRTLFYRLSAHGIEVASEPMALVVADANPPELNEAFIAHQLALRAGIANQSGFKSVCELPPAHALILDFGQVPRLEKYWFAPTELDHGRSLDDYAVEYRERLHAAVGGCLRGVERYALTLSGGMDSGSVVASLGGYAPAQCTLSYVFDDIPSADERAYAMASRDASSVPALQLLADELWPLRGGLSFPHSANVPIFNPYGLIKSAVNQAARDAGAQVVLTGTFGDHLFPAVHTWLEDALAQGQWGTAARALCADLAVERGRFWMSAGVRRAARRFLLSDRPKRFEPPWLTASALAHIDPYSLLLAGHAGHRRLATGLVAAQDCSGEAFFSEHEGLQWRNPFRDQRLVEFALRVPGHYAWRGGIKKAYARHAMRGKLPEFTRLRVRKTSLIDVYRRGVLHREAAFVKSIFEREGAIWRRFIQSDFVHAGRLGERHCESDEAVLWLTLCVEMWWARVLLEHQAAQELSQLQQLHVQRPEMPSS